MESYNITRENSYATPLANTTLLPLMLMSLATQKNAPTILQNPSTLLPEYDFIIVGAGSAGATVAARLTELPCIKVLLLEAGTAAPLVDDIPAYGRDFWFTDIDWQHKTVPQKHTARLLVDRRIIWPSGKGLGGTSILNAMLYIRGNKKNYDDWAALGCKGWSYKDVLPYFLKLEDEQDPRYLKSKYHRAGGPMTVETVNYHSEFGDLIYKAATDLEYPMVDPNAQNQTGFFHIQATYRNQQRCSTAKAYLVPSERRKNLHILTNAYATKILLKKNKAVGVSFEVDGKTHQVKAKREVIVSAGAVKTPQLLMLSGIGPKADLEKLGIPIVADLAVGHNLQDHAACILNFVLDSSIESGTEQVADPKIIEQYINHREGILAGPYTVAAMAFVRGLQPRPKVDFPTAELYFQLGVKGTTRSQFGITPEAYQQFFAPYENKTTYECFAQHLQPKSRGYIKLNSTNPHDPLIINPNYYGDPQDLKDVVNGLKVCLKIGSSKAMQKIGSKPFSTVVPGCEKYLKHVDDYFTCMARAFLYTIYHYVGTAKMGDPKKPDTVVDPELRVKGVDGLRVVDASVFPIITSGNTNIPTIMVAEKASDLIKRTLKCKGRSVKT